MREYLDLMGRILATGVEKRGLRLSPAAGVLCAFRDEDFVLAGEGRGVTPRPE
jgi:hypothetical protein